MQNEFVKKIRGQDMRTLIQAISAILILANMWFFTKLAPLTQQIALIDQRVESLESRPSNFGTTETNTFRIQTLERQYDRIEQKLDQVIVNQE